MPLSERQKHLLREIYEVVVPEINDLVFPREVGSFASPNLVSGDTSVRQRLEAAFGLIDADPSRVVRVGEILDEYECWALDNNHVDRDGYKFRYNRWLRNLKQKLFPFTGIWLDPGVTNRQMTG
jgi:hypothetical protein